MSEQVSLNTMSWRRRSISSGGLVVFVAVLMDGRSQSAIRGRWFSKLER